jgi:hypothetical protein
MVDQIGSSGGPSVSAVLNTNNFSIVACLNELCHDRRYTYFSLAQLLAPIQHTRYSAHDASAGKLRPKHRSFWQRAAITSKSLRSSTIYRPSPSATPRISL